MVTQTKTPEEIAAILAEADALVKRINREAWLAEGMTEEEYDRGEKWDDVFVRLLAQGLSGKEAEEWLDNASWEEIERRHREMYPQKYAASAA